MPAAKSRIGQIRNILLAIGIIITFIAVVLLIPGSFKTQVYHQCSFSGPNTYKQGSEEAINQLLGQNYSCQSLQIADNNSNEILHINAGQPFSSSSFITDTGQLSSDLFQQLFQANPKSQIIVIEYYGPVIDQYGNTTNGVEMLYKMSRRIFSLIDWNNFGNTQNYTYLCAFLNNQTGNNGCSALTSNLQKDEAAIKTK